MSTKYDYEVSVTLCMFSTQYNSIYVARVLEKEGSGRTVLKSVMEERIACFAQIPRIHLGPLEFTLWLGSIIRTRRGSRSDTGGAKPIEERSLHRNLAKSIKGAKMK